MSVNKLKNNIQYVWYGGIFLFLFLWFSQIHPLVIYDADDWTYIYYARRAIPTTVEWNPAKLLPEIIVPLCATIASRVVYLFTGDFIKSITFVCAFVVSGFITMYILCFGSWVKRVLDLPKNVSILAEVLFFVLHFLIFRIGDSNNTHLFFCDNLNCYFNYLVPGVLNAALVFYMTDNKNYDMFVKKGGYVKKGLFFVALYFAIFSNMVDNIVLGVYAGTVLLIEGIKLMKKKNHIVTLIKSNMMPIAILIAWGVCAVFEMKGRRAGIDIGDTRTFIEKIAMTIDGFGYMITQMHKLFIVLVGGIFGAAMAAFLLKKEKKEIDKMFILQVLKMSMGFLLVLVFMILLCARVNSNNIYRSEYLYPVFFYVLSVCSLSLGYLMKTYERGIMAVPLVLCITCTFINTSKDTFREPNYSNVSGKVCMEISSKQVEQIVEASKSGMESITLDVPYSEKAGNWPQTTYMGEHMAGALVEHGIIDYPIEIVIRPNVEINEHYHIEIVD